jgi:hypothetical protein
VEGGRQHGSFLCAVLLKMYQKLTKKRVMSKIWTKAKKVNEHPPPPPTPKKSIGERPYELKNYNLERNLRLWLNSLQSLELSPKLSL